MMIKEIVVTLFYLVLFNFLIGRYRQLQFKSFKPFVSVALFNIKFITGIFIWFIYTFYYTDTQNNDVHKFYNDAMVLRNVASQSPKDFISIIVGSPSSKEAYFDKYYNQMKNWKRNFDEAPFNENSTIIKLNALLMFLTLRVYFAHILFMCFISLLGWVLLTNATLKFVSPGNSIFAIPVLLLPSVLFWTSGVIKEPLLVLGLGIFITGLVDFNYGQKFSALATMGLGAFIILLIKFFVLACLIPTTIAFLLFRQSQNPVTIILKYAGINVLLLLLALHINRFVPSIDLQQMLVNKQVHSVKEAEYFKAGSRIEIPPLTHDGLTILKAAPVGIWNTIMRPYLWEGKNVMMLASAAENVLVIAFILLCLSLADFKNFKQLNPILFLLSFSLAYFALIGVCTPVLGNLVRYRAPLLPVLLFAFILLVKPDAMPRKLQFISR